MRRFGALGLLLLAACRDDGQAGPSSAPLARSWVGPEEPGCLYGSPLAWEDGAVTVEGRGTVRLLDLATGEPRWSVPLAVPEGEVADVYATPVLIGSRLVVAYHTLAAGGDLSVRAERLRQRVAVVDLEAGALDGAFAPLDLEARVPAWDGGEIEFLVTNALARARLVHWQGEGLGHVLVTYGNARDIQPWHGWIFELDLERWRSDGPGAAVAAVLVTTADDECGVPGESGSDDRLCGGGLWSPSGPLVVPDGDGEAAIVTADNGRLSLDRRDYANTLMRVRPGLAFDPGCDAALCAGFDPDDPDRACLESCRDLFVPRVLPGEEPPRPENGLCDGLTMFECWEVLDYAGGSTPVRVELPSGPVLVHPTKDGHLYLVDAEHLGTLLDREKLVDVCGTLDDECRANWAGMIVTQPAVTELDGAPLVVVPTFEFDDTHPAGLFGVAVLDDPPRLETRWRSPAADDPSAVTRWRVHPGRVALDETGATGFVLERPRDGNGWLVAFETATGRELAREHLGGPAQRYTLPLVAPGRVVVNSCDSDEGPGRLEGWSWR